MTGVTGLEGTDLEALSPAEMLRYARHLVLPEVGAEGQAKLKAARVLIVGAGGLGSPVSLYLAAAGVGTLGLIDFDVVDASNLHRQVLYGESDLGRPKLEAARERLRDLNPHIDIVLHEARLTSQNALDIIGDYDIVVDGTDNFPTRYLVNDACVLLGKRNVYGSILKFEGQVSVFGGDDAPCYRCLFRQPPPPGLVPNCAEGGVLGVLPGIIGSLQAMETIKLITGAGESLAGRLLLFDALKLRFRELKLRRNPECPVCGDDPTVTELIDYERFCGLEPGGGAVSGSAAGTAGGSGAGTESQATESGPDHQETGEVEDAKDDEIGAAELKERLDRGESVDLLDVREPFEWGIANLGEYGAKLIPMKELTDRLDELDPEHEIVVYCRSGARSERVTNYLRQHGFPKARNLRGGVLAWGDEVDPSFPKY
ncbi:MAG TPA: molybdopterin-synthase adenylyltransferase MoeB [Longimicrobiales bacterium]|nr:molybdopterin-synthase adenylyltransferase MoeB [Longimicrobiales bacterium]